MYYSIKYKIKSNASYHYYKTHTIIKQETLVPSPAILITCG